MLESYILRRDICGLTTKGYNRLFVGIIDRLRAAGPDKVAALIEYLSGRQGDTDRWPSDDEWFQGWTGRNQYQGSRQPRLRYILENIEQAKRSVLNEDIEIKSTLTVEHIMPQKWEANWPIPNLKDTDDPLDIENFTRHSERHFAINRIGNLTLLTHSLNTSVSNGPYSVKMPAVKAHSSLALNRELANYDTWDETTISSRGKALFETARKIWVKPSLITAEA